MQQDLRQPGVRIESKAEVEEGESNAPGSSSALAESFIIVFEHIFIGKQENKTTSLSTCSDAQYILNYHLTQPE